MSIGSILTPELREMLRTDDSQGLREFCAVLHPASAADCLEELGPDETWHALSHTDPERQAAIFQYLSESKQREMAVGAGRDRMARMLEEMSPDDRVDLLQELDSELVEDLLPLVAQAERQDIRRLLSYPEDSVGSVMTTDYAWLPEDLSAGEALAQLRLQAPDRETIYYIYVLNGERKLVGVVTLRQVILARPATKLSEFMDPNVIAVKVDDDKERAAQTLAHFDFIAIPVVDHDSRLVGILTHDDVIDVVVEAATEDAHLMGAVGPVEEDYLAANFWTLARSRVFWLTVLFLAELLTTWALGHAKIQKAIQLAPALIIFIPLIISAGGNSGSQSATLVVRALALGQLRLKDWFRVLRRELLMGLALGTALGLIGFLRTWWFPPHGREAAAQLALVVALSVVAVVTWGTLVGSLLPLVSKRLGMDPALTSSPFVASLVDVTGILIYFNIAWIYLLP